MVYSLHRLSNLKDLGGLLSQHHFVQIKEMRPQKVKQFSFTYKISGVSRYTRLLRN